MHCAMFLVVSHSVVVSLCLAFSAADIEFHCNNKFYYSTFIRAGNWHRKNLGYFRFLPRDASAERGDATVSCPSVCPSVCL